MTPYVVEHWPEIAVAVGSVVAVAVIGGLLTDVGPWYESLRFPRLRPPNWLFGPAWTVIFALIATSGVIAWNEAAPIRPLLAILFAANGALNIVWSPLFFKFRRPDWALVEIVPFWLSILALIVVIWPFSVRAALLLAPYLAWVTFAGWLNLRVVTLNAPFGREAERARR